MSNVIKASQISYAETIRTIDMNGRADEIHQKLMEKMMDEAAMTERLEEVSRRLEEEKILTSDDVDFVPGIVTEQLYLEDEDGVPGAEGAAVGLEGRLLEKRRELEELEQELEQRRLEAEHIINEANEQAKQILEKAMDQAEELKADAVREAQEQGYGQGMAMAEEELKAARQKVEELAQKYKEDYEKQVEELEPAFVEIVIKYVQKLTGIYAEDKRDIILHLIDGAMKDKKGIENFIIRVSEADFAMASYSKDSVRGYLSENASVEVVADKLLEKNHCMIETESRIFDCSLDGQMMNLIEDIRLLAERE